jgi:uncharacterized YigZ family protein
MQPYALGHLPYTIHLLTKLLYKTVTTHSEFEIPKIKWSRFIGNIFHIENKEEAEKYLKSVQERYRDATHNCYAYSYGTNVNFDLFGNLEITSDYFKCSDEGEPANTAGKPILAQIQGHKLHNVLIVVTRYFGGTLLGVGGLIQAYGEGAKQVIERAKIIETEIMKIVKFSYAFDLVPIVRNIVHKYDAKIEEKYDKDVEWEIRINGWYLEAFKKDLFDSSKGQIKL